ncbi:MAG: hypothetical protein K9G60_14325 [Pseudolabrys sp.]|nr:hypothetical protein [Pseudolabrys sp.]
MILHKKSPHASRLVTALSVFVFALSASQSVPRGTSDEPRPLGRIAAGPSCTQKQGQCEDKCVSAGGGNARVTECFHKCQAEADACK